MNPLHLLKARLQSGLSWAVIAVVIYSLSCAFVNGADTRATDSKLVEGQKPKPVANKLTGAELYSIHFARCHPERYPTERTAAQWKTILLHMRVRANLPADPTPIGPKPPVQTSPYE